MRGRPMSLYCGRFFAAALCLFVLNCAGGSGGGCSGGCLEPLPGGFKGTKSPNAVVTRIAPDGFAFLNKNWKTLIATMMPTAKVNPSNPNEVLMPFDFPCTKIANPGFGVGDIFVCDNGKGGPSTSGFMDGACDGNDAPCPIIITLEDLKLVPASPNKLDAQIKLRIDALRDINKLGSTCKSNPDPTKAPYPNCNIYLSSDSKTSACLFLKRMGCYMNFYSDRQGRSNEVLSASVVFSLDKSWEDLLTFDIPNGIGGIDKIESKDIHLGGTDRIKPNGQEEDMCDYACSLLDANWLKDLIVNAIKPQIDKMVKDTIAKQRCRKCDPADPKVPVCPGGSSCDKNKVCMSDAAHGGKCVPILLGVEGRTDLSKTLGAFGVAAESRIDLFVAGGGSVQASTDFQLGMLGGADSPKASPCVPDIKPPRPQPVPVPDLAGEGPAGHHVGLGLSEFFLDSTMYAAHRAGALCLNMTTARVSMLSTGLFKTFLPSLGVLAGTDTRDAPVMVALRPKKVPDIRIGEGTYDPVTKKPVKPLLTLAMPEMNIDFYALIEDRYVRLFTLTADIAMPLSLIVEGCPQTVTPALGDLKQLITNIRTSNSELLSEDPQVLAQLIPTIIGLAEPALAGALKGFEVPDMNGFRIKINKLKGINRIGGGDDHYHLGAFAEIKLAGQCASYAPETFARLMSTRIPTKEELGRADGRPMPWPSAVLEVTSLDLAGNGRRAEYGYRIDGGLWSTWYDGPRLEVEHPVFLLQGKHLIEVRSRLAEESESVDPTPAEVTFLVDWEPPEVALTADEREGRIAVRARDNVSPREALSFAYRLGNESLSSFGPERPIDLASVERFGSIEVQVRDEAGNVASATHRAPRIFSVEGSREGAQAAGGQTSRSWECCCCSAGGPGLFGFLALGVAVTPFLRRRRRERAN